MEIKRQNAFIALLFMVFLFAILWFYARGDISDQNTYLPTTGPVQVPVSQDLSTSSTSITNDTLLQSQEADQVLIPGEDDIDLSE